MIVWTIPMKARVELDAEGWWVYCKGKAFHFNSLAECLCYLAGRRVIKYDDIDFLIHATRERAGKV